MPQHAGAFGCWIGSLNLLCFLFLPGCRACRVEHFAWRHADLLPAQINGPCLLRFIHRCEPCTSHLLGYVKAIHALGHNMARKVAGPWQMTFGHGL